MLRGFAVLCCVVAAFELVTAYDPSECVNCMNKMPMPPGCPSPSACGFAPVDCTPCIPPRNSTDCKYADYCSLYTCTNCMDGMPMNGCPDPGVCGFGPIACVGCQVGNSTAGCPKPDWCTWPGAPATTTTTTPSPTGSTTTPSPTGSCSGCVNGKVTPGCPNPAACGYTPACDNCMEGMPMPNCPDYFACIANGTDVCMMDMVFNVGHQTCVLLSSWNISSGGQWFGTIVAIFAAAFLREFISFYRSYAMAMRKRARDAQKYSVNNPEIQQNLLPTSNGNGKDSPSEFASAASKSRPSPIPYASDSTLYFLQHFLSYLLMLVIMTYNFYLFLAVVLSFAISHFSIHYGYAACCRSRGQTNVQVKSNGKKAASTDLEEKTGGDHCCEDIEIDE